MEIPLRNSLFTLRLCVKTRPFSSENRLSVHTLRLPQNDFELTDFDASALEAGVGIACAGLARALSTLRCTQMPRVLVFLFIIGAIPWAIATWWEMRRSHGPRERAWVGRASVSLWLSCLIGSIVFFQLAMRGQFFALPIFIVAGLGARYGLRRVRARIRMDEGDPLSRARRLN